MSPRLGKVLVSMLVLSNIGVGLFGFYSLRAMDERYSALLHRVVPTLNDLQTLTAVATEAMHQTNPAVLLSPAQSVVPGRSAERAIEKDAQQRSILLGRYWLPSDSEKRVNFEQAGADFTRAANEFLDRMRNSPASEANQSREQILRPAFERYLVAITEAADALEADGVQASDALTVKTGRLSQALLAAGSWPVAVFFMIVLVSVAVLLLFIRSGIFRSEKNWRM